MRKINYCFGLSVLFILAASFVSLAPNFCFAAREDPLLNEDYQLESEKKASKSRLAWEIDFAYGLSSVSRLLGLGTERFPQNPSEEYLDTLGMVNSSNDFLLTLGASYLPTPKLGFSVGVPLSVVIAETKNAGRRHRKHSELKFAVGDIYGSISYALLPESKNRPLVITTFEINSALSKYTSMGDGFLDFTPGMYLRKFISGPVYALGLAGYSYRLKRRGAEPENNIRYGGGFGLLSGDKKLELTLERAQVGKTKIGGRVIMDSGEDLTLGVVFSTIFNKQVSTIGLFLGGLEEGLNWGKNSAGMFVGLTF